MDCIELPVEVIVADEAFNIHPPRPLRSLAEASELVDRDLGIFDAHVRAYHASEHFIPF